MVLTSKKLLTSAFLLSGLLLSTVGSILGEADLQVVIQVGSTS